MTEQEHNETCHQRVEEWFATHKARFIIHTPEYTGIEWKRQNEWPYAMLYTITSGNVIVTGDVGDAIYGFGAKLTFEMLKRFDWHYFVNKCVASETGRSYTMKAQGIRQPVTNIRAIAHYVGLQKAIKQLETEGIPIQQQP